MFTKALGLATAFATLTSALPHAPHFPREAGTPTVTPSPSPTPSPSGGAGGVTVKNNLDQEIYLWSVGTVARDMQTLAPNGGSFRQSWQTPDEGGVSLKMATEPDRSHVLQFEYTTSDPKIFWDLSVIDIKSRSLFTKYGFAIKPSNPSPECQPAVCKPGDQKCADAYLYPMDNEETNACPLDTSFEMDVGLI
jgi:hypothetical protein